MSGHGRSINNSHHNDGNNQESLEAKLHGVAATFRRERDEAHRRKELSQERLRLISEEVVAATKSMTDLKNKLDELHRQADASEQIQKLKGIVDDLTNRATFQHTELIGMRAELERLSDKRSNEASKRNGTIKKLREMLGERREHAFNKAATSSTSSVIDIADVIKDEDDAAIAEAAAAAASSSSLPGKRTVTTIRSSSSIIIEKIKKKRRMLEDELTCDVDHSLLDKWPNIVESKAMTISNAAENIANKENDVLERVLAGYRRQFGFEDNVQDEEGKAEDEDPSGYVRHDDDDEDFQEDTAIRQQEMAAIDEAGRGNESTGQHHHQPTGGSESNAAVTEETGAEGGAAESEPTKIQHEDSSKN